MKGLLLLIIMSLLLCVPAFAADGKTAAARTQTTASAAAAPFRTVTAPIIVDRPVRLTEYREQLIREYALQHYGEAFTEIVPQAVVVHWTESTDADGV